LGKIGYTITEAACAAGVEVRDIEVAVSSGHLAARRVLCLGKDRAIVLRDDIQAWLDTMPAWLG